MIPCKGDIFECQKCGVQLLVLKGSHISPYDAAELKCICGERPILLQSGSESAGDAVINNILAAANEPEA